MGQQLPIHLDPDSVEPLYHQLKQQLRTFAQHLPPDTEMPSESELMEATGVSRATIRRAVTDLGNEGVLRSRRGRRTFVVGRKVDESSISSFTTIVEAAGRTPSTRVLTFATVAAPDDVRVRLGLEDGALVHAIERIRLVDDVPCMVEHQYLVHAATPRLTEDDVRGSVYASLDSMFGIRLVDGLETIQAVAASKEIAQQLDVSRGSPILLTARVTLDDTGRRIEFVARYVRADMWSFTRRLTSEGSDPLPPPVSIAPMAPVTITETLGA